MSINALITGLFITSLIFPVDLIAQKTIKPKKLKKDLKELIKVVEGHPDPYRIIPEESFNQVVAHIEEQIENPMTVEEFYKLTSSLIALIKDGHSSLRMPRNWLKNKRKEHGVFPYKMHLSNDEKLYILKHYGGDKTLGGGTEVLAINGISVDSFITTVDPWISYEIPRFRNVIIEISFETYLNLVFGTSKDVSLKLAGHDEEVIVQNLPHKGFKDVYKDNEDEKEKRMRKGNPYEYTKLNDDVGLLNIYSFSVPDMDKYDMFLRKTFKKIVGDDIKSLILDVRGNFGGFPLVSSKLIHHLTDKPFKIMERSDTKISKAYRNYFKESVPPGINLKDYILNRSNKFEIDLDAVINDPIGSYKTANNIFIEDKREQRNEFRGDTYLLTDRVSFSAASSFAATFRCYELGTIIGDETGGTRIFHANAFSGLLGNSKIGYGMSSTKLYTSCPSSELDGVEPDIAFKPSILELASGFDSHLNFAKVVIKKVNKKKQQAKLPNRP